MPGLDFLYERVGDVEFPTLGTDVENDQLYSVFDPARDRLLALFRAAINKELGGAADSVVAGSPWAIARAGTNLASALPVAQVLHEPPTPEILREATNSFPLLALYRTTAVHEAFTLAIEGLVCTWGLDYILPPLQAGQQRHLKAALEAVRKLIPRVIDRRAHPAYENGALQFGTDKGGLATLKPKNSQVGAASFSAPDEGTTYYALHMDLESVELQSSTATETDFEGVDISIAAGSPELGTVPDLVEARTDIVVDPLHPKSEA